VELEQDSIELDVRSLGGDVRSILWNGGHHDVAVRHLGNDRFEVSGEFGSEVVQVLDPLTHLAATSHDAQAGPKTQQTDAYMPGRVVEVLVKEGDSVAIGEGVLVLEAMKMENEIQSERAGTVRKIFVTAGQAVEGGDPLYEIESALADDLEERVNDPVD
jgi:biotin carboxyl carrier protein